jgi:hypothetical protein
MAKRFSKSNFKNLIEDLSCDVCASKYCFLKMIMESLKPDPRTLVQIKCIEKFKWEESEVEGLDIGWEEAGFRWVDKGWAKSFNDFYDEDLTYRKIYSLIQEELKKS